MKKALLLVLAATLLAGCATQSYDTFRARRGGYDTQDITLNPVGMTAEQIKAILGTKFPRRERVSVAVFYMVGDWRSDTDDLKTQLVAGLSRAKAIERVVPVPSFIVPKALTFEAVQQVGVRTLSEYSLLVMGSTDTAASWDKLAAGKYLFTSDVDFMLVDNETTAIIAADKLISSIDVKIELFSGQEYEKAKKLLFEEQAKALTDKMNQLFDAGR